MATLSFTLDDAVATEIIAVICDAYEYDTQKLVGETQAQFAKRMCAMRLRGMVKECQMTVSLQSIVDYSDTSIV